MNDEEHKSADYRIWGAFGVSVVSGTTFVVALVIAYMSADQTNMALMIGAVIANMSSVLAFWVGTNANSARKTEIIAQQLPGAPPKGSA